MQPSVRRRRLYGSYGQSHQRLPHFCRQTRQIAQRLHGLGQRLRQHLLCKGPHQLHGSLKSDQGKLGIARRYRIQPPSLQKSPAALRQAGPLEPGTCLWPTARRQATYMRACASWRRVARKSRPRSVPLCCPLLLEHLQSPTSAPDFGKDLVCSQILFRVRWVRTYQQQIRRRHSRHTQPCWRLAARGFLTRVHPTMDGHRTSVQPCYWPQPAACSSLSSLPMYAINSEGIPWQQHAI